MKKLKKLLIAFCVFGFGTALQAQEVIATGGDYNSNSSGSVSYTIGELATASYTSGDIVLLEGFQSGSIEIADVIDLINVDFAISAYPNPVVAELKLIIENAQGKSLQYQVFDINGKLLKQNLIEADETTISFSNMVIAIYVVKVIDAKKAEIKSFTIVKK